MPMTTSDHLEQFEARTKAFASVLTENLPAELSERVGFAIHAWAASLASTMRHIAELHAAEDPDDASIIFPDTPWGTVTARTIPDPSTEESRYTVSALAGQESSQPDDPGFITFPEPPTTWGIVAGWTISDPKAAAPIDAPAEATEPSASAAAQIVADISKTAARIKDDLDNLIQRALALVEPQSDAE